MADEKPIEEMTAEELDAQNQRLQELVASARAVQRRIAEVKELRLAEAEVDAMPPDRRARLMQVIGARSVGVEAKPGTPGAGG